MSVPAPASQREGGEAASAPSLCPRYHEAIELIGKRWTGSIVLVLLPGPLRFSQVSACVPELSDRLLSERMKELEARGIVARTVISGPPVRVEYRLTEMGHELEPALEALKGWARRWLADANRCSR